MDWLTSDGEYTLSHARFAGVAGDQSRIPGSIESVLAGVVVATHDPLTASLRLRADRGQQPQVVAENGRHSRLAYRFACYDLAFAAFNLLGSHDNDITYFYAPRLPGEPAGGIEDFHVHPIEPRQFRLTATVRC